jgi:uncharacterized protein (TIGR03435 family)
MMRHSPVWYLHVMVAIFVLLDMVHAQQKIPLAQQKLSFEVASVRPARPKGRISQVLRITDRRVEIAQCQLRPILRIAFNVKEYQLDAPDWTKHELFDIRATIPEGATRADVPEMLQHLLGERFGLVTHVEARPMPAYDLVVAEGGHKMREVDERDEVEAFAIDDQKSVLRDVRTETSEGAARRIALLTDNVWNGRRVTRHVTSRSMYDVALTYRLTTGLDATRISMAEFTTLLAEVLDRPVIDATGLTGVFQFKVELPINETTRRIVRTAGLTASLRSTLSLDTPSPVAAEPAVESLGLKLESRKEPVPVVVVDKIERRPTEN